MIEIVRKEDCVGCAACVQICPKQCISFNEDEQGFHYPKVNLNLCIHCNLCEKVCPVIHRAASVIPEKVYAAKNIDEVIREHSSSGGVFFTLAKLVIDDGGVVFGVRFNENWEVEHSYTEELDGIKAFQTSKYVQSYIGKSFSLAENFLKSGRKVLFSGTPCQIAALDLYLRKDYGRQLIKVDIVCHGVPSPGVWSVYKNTLLHRLAVKGSSGCHSSTEGDMPEITGINFRDKKFGWENYGFSIGAVVHGDVENSDLLSIKKHVEEKELFFEPHGQNIYMQGFLKNLFLRPSCYSCPTKKCRSGADITLGDFWGIKKEYPELYSKGMVSLILAHNPRADYLIRSNENLIVAEADFGKALKCNSAIVKSVKCPKQADVFWNLFPERGIEVINEIVDRMKPSYAQRLQCRIFKYLSCVKAYLVSVGRFGRKR